MNKTYTCEHCGTVLPLNQAPPSLEECTGNESWHTHPCKPNPRGMVPTRVNARAPSADRYIVQSGTGLRPGPSLELSGGHVVPTSHGDVGIPLTALVRPPE